MVSVAGFTNPTFEPIGVGPTSKKCTDSSTALGHSSCEFMSADMFHRPNRRVERRDDRTTLLTHH